MRTVIVPPKEEHFVDGVYYRSGESYQVDEPEIKKPVKKKELDNGDKTIN